MRLVLLAQAGLASNFWDDAFVSASFIIDRLPSKVLNYISPYQKLFNTDPEYHMLKAFGRLCYPLLKPYNKQKLNFRSNLCISMSYSSSHKGYKAILPDGKVIVTRDIKFDESQFPAHLVAPAPHLPSHAHLFSHHIHFNIFPTHIPQPATPQIQPPIIPPTSTPTAVTILDQNNHPPNSTPTPSQVDTPPPVHHTDNSLQNDHIQSPAHTTTDTSPISPTDSTPAPHPSNTHHMTTRSKADIFKPKVYLTSISLSPYFPNQLFLLFSFPTGRNPWLKNSSPSSETTHGL